MSVAAHEQRSERSAKGRIAGTFGNHFKRFTRNFGMSDATPPATAMLVLTRG